MTLKTDIINQPGIAELQRRIAGLVATFVPHEIDRELLGDAILVSLGGYLEQHQPEIAKWRAWAVDVLAAWTGEHRREELEGLTDEQLRAQLLEEAEDRSRW